MVLEICWYDSILLGEVNAEFVHAYCRTRYRAAFRRVAGGALPERGRGEAAVARDARPYHGGLQRFQRMRIEEKGHNAHEGDAMVVKPRLLVGVSGDYDFAEVVVDASKGKCFLFPFRMVWDGKCRLDVNAFGCLVHNEIDFITHCLGYYECVCKIVNVFAYGDSVRLHAHDCVECVRDFARVGKTANSAHHDGHKRIKHLITFETVPFNDIAQVNCFVEERWLFKSCEDTSFVKGGCSGCFRPKIRSAA